ncbi:hypothetical protein KMI_10g16130 [Encephalitozoon hellem]|nr:hypothetical protein KMI_10g16130 [Encephalitozoon hellem]
MDIFGGKMDKNPWPIETTSIDINDYAEDYLDKCQCLLAKKTSKSRNVCTCFKNNKKLFQSNATSYISTHPISKEQSPLERRLKGHDLKVPAGTTQTHFSSARGSHANKKYQLYKTEMCRSHTEIGYCKYGDKCQFAHSKAELRYVQRHPKYKTETCKTFWEEGSCPYGKRCCFIHIPNTDMGNLPVHDHQKDSKRAYKNYELALGEIDKHPDDGLICSRIDRPISLAEKGFLEADEGATKSTAEECNMSQSDFFNEIHILNRPFCKSATQSFVPIIEDESSDEVMLRRPFWESNYSSAWLDEETSLFYLDSPCRKQPKGGVFAPGGSVYKPFNKKVSDFVFGHLGM